jgi:preprotein translocase subunit YajC
MLGLAFAMSGPAGGAAAQGPQSVAAMVQTYGMPIVLIAIFYFLLIRPQQKKAKEHQVLLDALKKGDQVITASGVHGKIISVNDDVVSLEIAPNVVIKIVKSHIASVI